MQALSPITRIIKLKIESSTLVIQINKHSERGEKTSHIAIQMLKGKTIIKSIIKTSKQ
jgi:hypothetical protein